VGKVKAYAAIGVPEVRRFSSFATPLGIFTFHLSHNSGGDSFRMVFPTFSYHGTYYIRHLLEDPTVSWPETTQKTPSG
jgi:hypothetical protein